MAKSTSTIPKSQKIKFGMNSFAQKLPSKYVLPRNQFLIIIVQRSVKIVKSPYEAAMGAAAIVIATEWDEFRTDQLDYERVYRGMKKPAYLFDGRLIVDEAVLREIGFNVEVI